jgi:uncharacterized membrane protein YphA (DoxX/SURF4 family)
MNAILWIVQILLALVFSFHGWMMIRTIDTAPQPMLEYFLAIPLSLRRFIGVAEILAGICLVLPALTGILPWLTPLAAVGLVILMAGAVIFHIPRKEYPNIVFNLILLALAAFVAYGRYVVFPL